MLVSEQRVPVQAGKKIHGYVVVGEAGRDSDLLHLQGHGIDKELCDAQRTQ